MCNLLCKFADLCKLFFSSVLPIEGKIRVLDVGSCFNPFADYDDFLAVGIDISPANPVSLQYLCFLKP